jgi:hypothetical protein
VKEKFSHPDHYWLGVDTIFAINGRISLIGELKTAECYRGVNRPEQFTAKCGTCCRL